MNAQNTRTKLGKSCELYPYPSCWSDDARVQVLLAPFRDRSVNQENYDSKMKFWQNTIKEYCLFKGKANFCRNELELTFTKYQRVPCCLDMVLEEMQRKKLIRLLGEYEYDPEDSWSGWAINSVLKSFYWGFDKLKLKIGAHDASYMGLVQYIHLEVVKKYCLELQELLYQPPYLGSLQQYEMLKMELCSNLNISEDCLGICLRTLSVQKKIGLEYKSKGGEIHIDLVKIPSKEDNDVNITATDHAINNLKVTKNDLENQLEQIELEIKGNEDKARQYIQENKRTLAKNILRKKHLLEKNHERRSLALNNIETLLLNVHEAKMNGVILDAYKFGSKALQNVLDVSNLKHENVDEIVSDVQDAMDSFREVQDSLANINTNQSLDSLADEDELEKELKEIMGESATNTPAKNTSKNNTSTNLPIKVEITDAELLDMLNGLEIEKSPTKDVDKKIFS